MSSVLEWKESYSVGIKKIDHQHKKLLEIMNELSGLDSEEAKDEEFFVVINSMIEYANSHFKTEEKYMEEHGYPGYEQQKKEHNDFIEKIFSLHEELANWSQEIHYKISDYLKDWYISHVLGTDMKYKDFFSEKGLK